MVDTPHALTEMVIAKYRERPPSCAGQVNVTIEAIEHLLHHLTASSVLLQGLSIHADNRTLCDQDLNASLKLLISETDASRELAAATLVLTRASAAENA